MKVKLLVNLKIEKGTISQGKIFSGNSEDFPEYIQNNLNNPKIVKILEDDIQQEEAAPILGNAVVPTRKLLKKK